MVGLRRGDYGRRSQVGWGGTYKPHPRACALSCPSLAVYRAGALTSSDPSLCPTPMPQGRPAPTFVDNGGRHPRVPRSPPGFHHSPSTLLSQAPLCEKPLILRTGFGHLVL